jgi:hypothetical protein
VDGFTRTSTAEAAAAEAAAAEAAAAEAAAAEAAAAEAARRRAEHVARVRALQDKTAHARSELVARMDVIQLQLRSARAARRGGRGGVAPEGGPRADVRSLEALLDGCRRQLKQIHANENAFIGFLRAQTASEGAESKLSQAQMWERERADRAESADGFARFRSVPRAAAGPLASTDTAAFSKAMDTLSDSAGGVDIASPKSARAANDGFIATVGTPGSPSRALHEARRAAESAAREWWLAVGDVDDALSAAASAQKAAEAAAAAEVLAEARVESSPRATLSLPERDGTQIPPTRHASAASVPNREGSNATHERAPFAGTRAREAEERPSGQTHQNLGAAAAHAVASPDGAAQAATACDWLGAHIRSQLSGPVEGFEPMVLKPPMDARVRDAGVRDAVGSAAVGSGTSARSRRRGSIDERVRRAQRKARTARASASPAARPEAVMPSALSGTETARPAPTWSTRPAQGQPRRNSQIFLAKQVHRQEEEHAARMSELKRHASDIVQLRASIHVASGRAVATRSSKPAIMIRRPMVMNDGPGGTADTTKKVNAEAAAAAIAPPLPPPVAVDSANNDEVEEETKSTKKEEREREEEQGGEGNGNDTNEQPVPNFAGPPPGQLRRASLTSANAASRASMSDPTSLA